MNRVKNVFFVLILGFFVFKPCSVYAQGDAVRGGGDGLEEHVDEIRSNLLNWIKNGGAKNLEIDGAGSKEFKALVYETKMKLVLSANVVVFSFTDQVLSINGKQKTCIWEIPGKKHRPTITCNLNRFKSLTQTEQYRLIHHEYAGIAGIENAQGAVSSYKISNQISDSYSPVALNKLLVNRRAEFSFSENDLAASPGEYLKTAVFNTPVTRVFTGFRDKQNNFLITKIKTFVDDHSLRFSSMASQINAVLYQSAVLSKRAISQACKNNGFKGASLKLSEFRVEPVHSDQEYETVKENFLNLDAFWYANDDGSLQLINEIKCLK